MTTPYGRKLHPLRRLREPYGFKGERQSVSTPNADIATATPRMTLRVPIPNTDENKVIVPGSARLAFNIVLKSPDLDRSVVQNLSRAIISKLTARFGTHEVLSFDHSDVFYCYMDLWKTPQERANGVDQGIDTSPNMNVTRLRVGAKDASSDETAQVAIADAYKNRFFVPLDFEFLETHGPYHQGATTGRLEFLLTFNDAGRVMLADDDSSTYSLENICIEYDTIASAGLYQATLNKYAGSTVIYYDRITTLRATPVKREDTHWVVGVTIPCNSLRGVLMLWVNHDDDKDFDRNQERFHNPKITRVSVRKESATNHLYDGGMSPYHQWEEARKFFAGGYKRQTEVAAVAKDLELADVSLGEFLTTKYCLWLDFRSTDDDQLTGSGLKLTQGTSGLTITLTREKEPEGLLNCYVYLIHDAQLNIEGSRYSDHGRALVLPIPSEVEGPQASA